MNERKRLSSKNRFLALPTACLPKPPVVKGRCRLALLHQNIQTKNRPKPNTLRKQRTKILKKATDPNPTENNPIPEKPRRPLSI